MKTEDEKEQREKEAEKVWLLKIHESMLVNTFPVGGSYPTQWIVTRVPTGWIYHEENPRIQRQPMTVFVPLTTYSSPTV